MKRLLKSLAVVCGAVMATVSLSGCGSSSGEGGDGTQTVKIVSSMPRTGSAKAQTDTIVNGIKMALDEAGWKAGPFNIEYQDMDDATAATGNWAPEIEAANAERAAKNSD